MRMQFTHQIIAQNKKLFQVLFGEATSEEIDELIKNGATVTAFDPEAMRNVKALLGNRINFANNQYEALENADALLIVTEWADFRSPNFEKIKNSLLNPIVFDGRNIYDTKELNELGFEHYGIGTKNK